MIGGHWCVWMAWVDGTAVGSWHGGGSEVHCTGGCVGGIGGHCGVGG